MTSSEPKIAPEIILNLKDRLKHGQNVTKILESQLDTAQQNISLLQGQVRLANETILNLKKHFQETEKILSHLVSPNQQPSQSSFEIETKDSDTESSQKHVDSTTRSPLPEAAVTTSRSFDERNEKSPYAIQLKQVLDVLDEEPKRPVLVHRPDSAKDCNCLDCQTTRKQYVECDYESSSCSSEHYRRKSDESCKVKPKSSGHNHHNTSPKAYSRSESHSSHSLSYSQCSGPCCANSDRYKMMEKPSTPVHYVSMRSSSGKHGERHHHGHCSDKCQCHSYVNYVPYGYRVVEGRPGMLDSMPPMSPSTRRKRSYAPVLPGEEPPHLKYTKVKRIDGSKLTAQKVLQDFTKRRFLPYNPKYDLDLLIVPPPLPAMDLIQSVKAHSDITKSNSETHLSLLPSLYKNGHEENSLENLNVIEKSKEILKNGSNNSGNNILCNDNNNNNETSNFYAHPFKTTSLPKTLSTIKEERNDGRSKLEDHISKLRKDSTRSPHGNNRSPHANNFYNEQDYHVPTLNLKQERTVSPAGGK